MESEKDDTANVQAMMGFGDFGKFDTSHIFCYFFKFLMRFIL